jgi:hypothetical protein
VTVPNNKEAKSLLNGHADELIAAIKTRNHDGFISPEQLAEEFHLPSDDLRKFLDTHSEIVRRADVMDRRGNPLYALATRPVSLIERWGRLYSYINKEPLPSYRPE